MNVFGLVFIFVSPERDEPALPSFSVGRAKPLIWVGLGEEGKQTGGRRSIDPETVARGLASVP